MSDGRFTDEDEVEVAVRAFDTAKTRVMKHKANRKAAKVKMLTMAIEGYTHDEIAAELGMSRHTVVTTIYRTLEKSYDLTVEKQRYLENARLDVAQRSIWAQVTAGDLRAVETFLKLSKHRAAINGLNAPVLTALAVTVSNEMEEALRELEALVNPDTKPPQVIEGVVVDG
jgi:predicted transcriptional regulator